MFGFLTSFFKNWSIKIAVTKILKRAIAVVLAFIFSAKAMPVLTNAGIVVDLPVLQGTIWGFVELARNYIKTRFNLTWL